MGRVLRAGLAAAAAAGAVLGAGVAGPAAAADVGCGTVVTADTTLTADVGPCRGPGLVVGADGVVLDLGGHQVFGTGTVGEGAGILVSERTGVTVRNGTVRLFDGGVAVVGGSGNTVTGITARDNIGVSEGQASAPGAAYGDGIAILSSTGNVVEGNTVVHNGPFSGIGLYEAVDGDHPRTIAGPTAGNVVRDNVVLANNVCRTPFGSCDDDGIRLEPGVQFTTVVGNYVQGSGLDGISLFRTADDNRIAGNVVEHNGHHRAAHRKGDGVRVFSNRNVVEGNDSRYNGADGIGVGFRRPNGTVVPATANRLLANRTGFNGGLDLHDFNPGCDANVWLGNTFGTADPACTTG
ncbi:MAG TPA: right-handed parallel beta-helix repeat-containing protein [Acidimicrobiales bacterium]|nr:right-handed parallel beta-helix repeat-containing protein [Acidimicrobiales bacterium]